MLEDKASKYEKYIKRTNEKSKRYNKASIRSRRKKIKRRLQEKSSNYGSLGDEIFEWKKIAKWYRRNA